MHYLRLTRADKLSPPQLRNGLSNNLIKSCIVKTVRTCIGCPFTMTDSIGYKLKACYGVLLFDILAM